MSRIPPALLYLTIYNPTLRPSGLVSHDDEDAEEQAHILFYTSRERAVSRDKMLRQVGLAKALINFSEIFNPRDPCQNVHSQTRRMIMVNPEPDFWIHASIEVARTPRPLLPKNKGREKEKGKGKDKQKEKVDNVDLQPSYDYHDGSMHDYALRAHLLRGYEHFKLTHGSFTSILSSIGQQALELQLERFFTVWAWTWDLEKGYDLSIDLGLPLHPYYHTILPLIDTFTSEIPEHIAPLILCPPHVSPATRYREFHYPPALARHLLTLVPPPLKDENSTPRQAIQLYPAGDASVGCGDKPRLNGGAHPSSGFLGMPAVNLNMDVRKWSWPGALTFGKGPSQRQKSPVEAEIKEKPSGPEETVPKIDEGALEDAISSELPDSHSVATGGDMRGVAEHSPPSTPHEPSVELVVENTGQDPSQGLDTPKASRAPSPAQPPGHVSPNLSIASTPPAEEPFVDPPLPSPTPDFLFTQVFLADNGDLFETQRRRVPYMRVSLRVHTRIDHLTCNDEDDLEGLRESAARLLQDIQSAVLEATKRSLEASLPSATKILQPKDNHLVSTGQFTSSSPGFVPKSEHLYNGKELLEREPEILEVFSRGQNPQHWHIVSRGSAADDVYDADGEMLLEVSRKEASLADVGNDLQRLHRLQP
ncbi:hypothetical protein BV22DRAFT_1007247 [Leucogyrophana mollusca]|uniref:Uncharacterized protein n=1 Tax=Leucogyrophana mollusca TaxID=85980 RepID=A0ACB8BPR9_9AGAM|nr:hypothetical protein BV22DRAFT_1007247 [Leucogyrophana mollusca]